MQPKLLRVLEGHEVQGLGGERGITLRARIVAASHVDLETCVAAGTFREDLYYRLAVHVIRVPPLRERIEDLPELVEALLRRHARPKRLTEAALAVLATRAWPGNVRQLAAFLERLAVRVEGEDIDADDVLAVERASGGPPRLSVAPGIVKVASPQAVEGMGRYAAEMQALGDKLVDSALAEAKGNVSEAARRLGMPRMALVRRLAKRAR